MLLRLKLSRALYYFQQFPGLAFGNRARLRNSDGIADAALVVFVMSMDL
jgi:hypothetical protein